MSEFYKFLKIILLSNLIAFGILMVLLLLFGEHLM